jgi:hypothetical protein
MSHLALRVSALAFAVSLASASAALSQTSDTPHKPTTLTIGLQGTTGPVLAGSDIAGLRGKSAAVTLLLSELVSPKSATSTVATYRIPAGAVTLVVGSTSYKNASPARMKINLTKTADILTLTYVFSLSGIPVSVIETSYLAKNSWASTVLAHPGSFTPSPQSLVAAATASGRGSKLKYAVEGFTCVLGIAGTATSSSAPDAVLPDDEDSE